MVAVGIMAPGTITKVVPCYVVTVSLVISEDVRASFTEIDVVKPLNWDMIE